MTKRGKFKSPFEAVKPSVLERDQNRCIKCQSDLALEIHHIEGYKTNDPELLATLCYLCHGVAPMGKVQFSEWLASGDTGIAVLQRNLAKRNLILDVEQIKSFCAALNDTSTDMLVSKFRKAREHIRQSGIRCEGIKPYGDLPGEAETMLTIRSLRSSGLSCDKIAAALNLDGVPARHGGKWGGAIVNRILKRESLAAGIPWEPRRKPQ